MTDRQHQALRMIETLASVGGRQFDITFTDLDGRKRGFRPRQSLHDVCQSMRSTLIESCVKRGTNIIVRPHSPPPVLLIQLDDLNATALARVAPAAFLVLSTSPTNHQAWLAVEGWNGADFARRVKTAAGADLSASGATRVAGTVNFKLKYAPAFPTVAILEARAGGIVHASELDRIGMLAATEQRSGFRPAVSTRAWPSYSRCLDQAPCAHNSDQLDVSRADFTWCLIAADWGHCADDIAARLLVLSRKARENGEAYATMTADRAVSAT